MIESQVDSVKSKCKQGKKAEKLDHMMARFTTLMPSKINVS